MSLIWQKSATSYPNTFANRDVWTLWVSGYQISVDGPTQLHGPGFIVRGGRKRFDNLEAAKRQALKNAARELNADMRRAADRLRLVKSILSGEIRA